MEAAGLHLVLDQGLPRQAAERLRADGMSCVHVGELGMATAADTEILEWARVRNAVVVTLDADFHAILAVQNAVSPSVVRIRLQGMDGLAIASLLNRVIARYAAELAKGCMVTVKPRKTTCRMLAGAE